MLSFMAFFKCVNMLIIIFIFFLCATPIFSDSSSTTSKDHLAIPKFLELAKEPQVFDWMVDIRRKIHENPEVSYEEFETSKLIRTKLDELGVPYKHPVAVTGVIGYIGTGLPPFVALRAEMDALLMQVRRSTFLLSECFGFQLLLLSTCMQFIFLILMKKKKILTPSSIFLFLFLQLFVLCCIFSKDIYCFTPNSLMIFCCC